MASGTIYGDTANEYIESKIEWESTVNASALTSTVTATLYYRRTNTGYTTSGTGSFTISIGSSKKTDGAYLAISTSWVKAITYEATVSHSTSTGKASVTISATGSIPDTTLTATSVGATVDLDTIATASTITEVANRTLGTYCYVTWTPKLAALRYKIKFSLGDWSETTGYISPKTTNAYTYIDFQIPKEDVAPEITSSKTGTMTATLYTYSGTTQIGSSSSKTFTVTVPDNSSTKPTATMTLSPVSSLDSPFDSLYIKGYSKVDANFSDGSAKYGATIKSYSMTVQGKSYSSPYTSGYLSTTGDVDVEGTVTDSRGISRTYTQTINVISYSSPKILPASDESGIICERCDADGNLTSSGTYLKIKARRSYSKVTSDGVQNNFCTLRYRYRPETTNTYSSWITLLSKDDTSTNTVDSDPIANVVSSATTSYIVQVGVVDDIGEASAVQFIVPTDHVTLHLSKGGKRLGLLRYAMDDDEEGIDVGAPIHGGAVDNLTLGTRITATEASPIDLNDYKEVGNYYSPSATYSQYVTNTPYTDGGFGLIVRNIQTTDYISQTMYYGRTRWVRHWDGSEWSDWLRFLMTATTKDTAEDFVIEQGKYETDYGTWSYKKWLNGTYQMFGKFEVTPTESTVNSVIYRTNSIQIPSPFTVKSAYVGGSAMGHYWISNGGVSSTYDAVAFRLISDKTFSTTTAIEARLIVMGTYG